MYYVDAEGHLRQMHEMNGHPAEELTSFCDGLICAPLQTRGYPAEEMLDETLDDVYQRLRYDDDPFCVEGEPTPEDDELYRLTAAYEKALGI